MRRVDHVLTEERLTIERAARGDAASFGLLVERYQEVAFRAAYLVLRDAGAAEDAAQDAFVRAYRQLHSFRPGEPFRPWLLRIVTNLALNEIRARKRREGLLGRIALFTERSTESPHATLAANDEASALLRAISELPADDEEVLHLRYYLELPEREIATAIGKPAGTVKSRLHRAGRRLRDVIQLRYPDLRESISG